ncbi:MAG: four helix bundle protein [Marinoscillum sp.]
MSFKFENLKVWQRALDFTGQIDLLIKSFPDNERFALSSQMKRAGDSIALNIAEGSTGQSNKEFARFLGIALRSGIEVVGCLYLGRKRQIITDEDFLRMYRELEEIIRMIQALRNSLK